MLIQQHRVKEEIAKAIVDAVWNRMNTANVRDCVMIVRMTKSIEDIINFIVNTFLKHEFNNDIPLSPLPDLFVFQYLRVSKVELKILTDKAKEQNAANGTEILDKEIALWRNGFEYALRDENRLLFNKMLTECQKKEDYIKAADSKGERYSADYCL